MINKEKIRQLTYEFLIAIGEDPNREGLIDTPRRVADMYEDLFDSNRADLNYTVFIILAIMVYSSRKRY